ncbi:MAG: response regulator transcription factor [Gemmatimonadota bacterium]
MINKLRIVLADDHAVVREGLRALIERQADMEVVGEAADGRTAIEVAEREKPDVVVMDLTMPILNGTKATRELMWRNPGLKVLALTVHEERSYLRELLDAGASGYLLKRVASEELVHAIRRVAEGGVYLDGRLMPDVLDRFFRIPGREDAGETKKLTPREEEVFRLIAHGHSNKEIAGQLSVSVKTIETHKARALEKLGINNRAGIVRYALQQGWMQEG